MCQGCGTKMETCSHIPATEGWHEYCGDCNRRYYEARQTEEKLQHMARNDYEAKLIAKYGYDNAMEILGDMNFYG